MLIMSGRSRFTRGQVFQSAEFDDVRPFTKMSFEPYIAEHVLADA